MNLKKMDEKLDEVLQSETKESLIKWHNPKNRGKMNWLITIPKTIQWSEYEKELKEVELEGGTLNYKTRYIPKEMKVGDRMYIVWNGRVRGWMEIVGFGYQDGFTCSTTGNYWSAGYYIQRSGKFHEIEGEVYQGFRGIRKYRGEN